MLARGAVSATRQHTQTIPIVMANSTDPVGTGFVKEVVPGLSRVALLWDPEIRGAMLEYRETETAARSLNLQLQSITGAGRPAGHAACVRQSGRDRGVRP